MTNLPVFLYGGWTWWFLCGKIHYSGHWKGWALKILTFFGPKWYSLPSLSFQGPKKSRLSVPTPSNGPWNAFSRIRIIMSRAIITTGTLIVNIHFPKNSDLATQSICKHISIKVAIVSLHNVTFEAKMRSGRYENSLKDRLTWRLLSEQEDQTVRTSPTFYILSYLRISNNNAR
jgi:hypothetical protein